MPTPARRTQSAPVLPFFSRYSAPSALFYEENGNALGRCELGRLHHVVFGRRVVVAFGVALNGIDGLVRVGLTLDLEERRGTHRTRFTRRGVDDMCASYAEELSYQ
jgi:hypothetical protein